MVNMCCVDNGHQYGLWHIDNNIGWRCCNKCKFRRELPITSEICEEVKKQDEALKLFRAFQMVDNHDKNIINYLNLILEDYIHYLDRKNLVALTSRIKELEQLDIINLQDAFYTTKLDGFIQLDKIETSNSYIQVDELNTNADSSL